MIPEALEITRKFMSKPVRILVKPDEMSLEGIKQFYVNLSLVDTDRTLIDVMSVIFLDTRRNVDWLTDKMRSRDHTVSATHGDMDQNTRDIIMREFRAAGVSGYVNFDLPMQPENYLTVSKGVGGLGGKSNLLLGACNSCCEPQKQLSENPDTLEDNGSENLQEFQDCRLCFTLHFLLVVLDLNVSCISHHTAWSLDDF
ncbi:hypothetical protein DY000_02040578 [Brassica cretica]|uniref:Uncharacterized protein n=1 Tax=Brassica cretica TaxID=69181 RepID=A0ABQ7BID6_BRACR|nr:hypothetical protein DY000_02040578 [Brassica cretica]